MVFVQSPGDVTCLGMALPLLLNCTRTRWSHSTLVKNLFLWDIPRAQLAFGEAGPAPVFFVIILCFPKGAGSTTSQIFWLPAFSISSLQWPLLNVKDFPLAPAAPEHQIWRLFSLPGLFGRDLEIRNTRNLNFPCNPFHLPPEGNVYSLSLLFFLNFWISWRGEFTPRTKTDLNLQYFLYSFWKLKCPGFPHYPWHFSWFSPLSLAFLPEFPSRFGQPTSNSHPVPWKSWMLILTWWISSCWDEHNGSVPEFRTSLRRKLSRILCHEYSL